jgi:hypothetical protein
MRGNVHYDNQMFGISCTAYRYGCEPACPQMTEEQIRAHDGASHDKWRAIVAIVHNHKRRGQLRIT